MSDVVVTGIGLTTALGPTAEITWQRLMAGESAIALRQPFVDLAPGPLAMMGKHPAELDSLIAPLVAAACQDAGLSKDSLATDRCGVVLGSSRSHLQQWERMAIAHTKNEPIQNWLSSLPHQPAISVAQQIGARGPVLAPMAACATGVWAVVQGADLIRSGVCDRVLAGAIEAPITPLTIAGFRKMGALAKTGCYPFDVNREGFVLGEGGALMMLESAKAAEARGASAYGKVLAAGITNDSHHVSSFDPSYAMGQQAVDLCLQRSGLLPEEIDAVHTHGTSTAQNDRMEASLIQQRLSSDVQVMATKGATGHTLGASGALIVALSLLSLREQAVVPCIGLKEADFDLNFVRASQQAKIEKMLCFSFGFGGQNAVLALSQF